MHNDKENFLSINFKITIVFWFLIIMGFIAIFRIINLQIISYSFYKDKARKMHLSTIKQQIGRGSIFDRNSKILAESIKAQTIYICPRNIEDKRKVLEVLKNNLNLPESYLLKKISSKRYFEYIKRKVDAAVAEKILSYNLPGVYAQVEEKRFYPIGESAAHVIGFTGLDNTGLEGLEFKYEKYLHGKTGRLQIKRDALGRPILIDSVEIKKAERGADLYLTIDSNLQVAAYNELKQTVEKFKANSGTVIIMNPNNGEIYAMTNYPSYDPYNFKNYEKKLIRNKAITDFYEPGSTFKIFTMSAFLREFKNGEQHKIFCGNGEYEYFGRKVHDHEKHGWLTVPEIIKFSSNIGIVNLALKVGQEKLYNEYSRFGFGKETGIDLPGETNGILRHYKNWDNISLTSIPYGQEVAVTSIQLAKAYSIIANGGYDISPHVVDKIVKNNKVIYKSSNKRTIKIIEDEERQKLISMLTAVTENDGSGKKAAISGYRVAGKTGTAQKHNPDGKGYAKGKYVASFIGFLPADKPEVLTLVVIDEPKTIYFGSEVAAPLFKNLSRIAISTLKISSDKTYLVHHNEKIEKNIEMPDLFLKDIKEAKLFFKNEDLNYKIFGNGKKIIAQIPKPGTKLNNQDVVYIVTGDILSNDEIKIYMPDIGGLPIRTVIEILNSIGLKVKCNGSGFAISQHPKPGAVIKKGQLCIIDFAMKDEG
ncbi:MAG: penicillin-binding transpeptidase domain-containing protein [Candidatus Goldbacteria bacterium]|nr:penicillin-binding transpeptidase domain-containing protein [Candidatus Goldiibacteriota bacterium]